MNLRQQVQQHLQNTGISLRELSRRSGVSHTTIGKILRGGTYKSDTAHALYSLISITPISTYKTLDATVEQLAAQCIDSDLTHVRDTELECAKYRRVMALEAELDAWQLKCGKERDKSEQLQNELRHAETLAHAYSKDLQIMSASWKAVSVERDNLERELKAVKHSNTLLFKQNLDLKGGIESSKEQVAGLHDQLEKADIAYTTLHKDASYAKYVAWACSIASLLIVLQAAFVAFGGAV